MSDQALPTCSNCPFWAHAYADRGECHRHAPRPGISMSWPETGAADACGEHPDFEPYIIGLRSGKPFITHLPSRLPSASA